MQKPVVKKGMVEELKSTVLYLEIGDGRQSSAEKGKWIWHRAVDVVASTFDAESYRKIEEGCLTQTWEAKKNSLENETTEPN